MREKQTYYPSDDSVTSSSDNTVLTEKKRRQTPEEVHNFSCDLAEKELEERLAEWELDIELIGIDLENWESGCVVAKNH